MFNMITQSKKQLYQVTRSLYPEDFTPKISLWFQLKHSNFIVAQYRVRCSK